MNLLSQSIIEDIFCFSIFVDMEDRNILDQNHEPGQNRILKPTLEYGVISALVIIAYTLVAYFLGFLMESLLNWVITMFIYAVLITWILKNYRSSEGNGFLNYGRALGIGTLTFVWAGVISAIFSYIFFAYIAPDFIDQMLEVQYNTIR
jgi:magnesium-transporting ATPase (P-type)